MNAVICWLFEEEKLDAIICAHFDWNTRSARVQAKCGFHFLKESSYKTTYGTVEKDIINVLYRHSVGVSEPHSGQISVRRICVQCL